MSIMWRYILLLKLESPFFHCTIHKPMSFCGYKSHGLKSLINDNYMIFNKGDKLMKIIN